MTSSSNTSGAGGTGRLGRAAVRLAELAGRASRWLGLTAGTGRPASAAPAGGYTGAVVTDRFDRMAWADTLDQAPALGELADDLAETHDHTRDLLADVFHAVHKTDPALRPADQMDPARRVNHRVLAAVMDAPETGELRRHTAGDAYAAAMGVLATAPKLRELLARAEPAQRAAEQAAEAARAERDAAAAVAQALADAAAAAHHDDDQADDDQTGDGDSDGGPVVPGEQAERVEQALAAAQQAADAAQAAAQQAQAALAAAVPGLRTQLRAALGDAAAAAEAEAALMRAWGVGPGELERMPFAARAQLAARLAGGRLGRFAALIGRFRQMATAQRARRVEHVPGELIGITIGDDVSRLVPSELAALGVPALRPLFAARYAAGELMLYDSRGEHTAGQGAIIACIDCSGSMRDQFAGVTAEAWAKALALALLDQAQAARRDFAAILFSSAEQTATFVFPGRQRPAIDQVVDLAEHFFGGGTDYAAPLTAAIELLETQYNSDGAQRGDIVLVTDGQCDVTEDWMRGYQAARRQLGFRTFGVAIGTGPATGPDSTLAALCDNLRAVTDLTGTAGTGRTGQAGTAGQDAAGGAIDATSDLFRLI